MGDATVKQKRTQSKNPFEWPDGDYCLPGGNGFQKRGCQIFPSPGRMEIYGQYRVTEAATQTLLVAVNQYAQQVLEQNQTKLDRFWSSVAQDLGIETCSTLMYELRLVNNALIHNPPRKRQTQKVSRRG